MAAPRVGEQLVVQDPLEGPEQDSGQVALITNKEFVYGLGKFYMWICILRTHPDPETGSHRPFLSHGKIATVAEYASAV
jgi:hypothetical protein